MDLDAFINRWNGQTLDWDGAFGGQCVDLANAWAHALGQRLPILPAAADFWDCGPIAGFDRIANTPAGVPEPGDIVIWGHRVGEFGHIAVFVSGDANAFVSFDQNWPVGSRCHRQAHDYTGVLGWFHPQSSGISTAAGFQGTIGPAGAHVRRFPGADAPIVPQPGANPDVLDGGTVLTFTGWCLHAPRGGGDRDLFDTTVTPPRLDNRWYRSERGNWIASVGVDLRGADPPPNLRLPDPGPPAPAPMPVQPNLRVPEALTGMAAWETSPTDAAAADYDALATAGFRTVLIRAANGDGSGAHDLTVFEPNWRERAPAAARAGLVPVPWTYWYGPSEGVSGDVATYLLGCAEHTASLDVGEAPAWVVDAEDRDLPGLAQALIRLSIKTGKPVLLCPPGDPRTYGLRWNWAELAGACAGWMPQLYTALWQPNLMTFEKALGELRAVGAQPLYPVLNEAEPARIREVVAKVRAAGFAGASWWCVSNSPQSAGDYVGAWAHNG
jgi:hypothetical protein